MENKRRELWGAKKCIVIFTIALCIYAFFIFIFGEFILIRDCKPVTLSNNVIDSSVDVSSFDNIDFLSIDEDGMQKKCVVELVDGDLVVSDLGKKSQKAVLVYKSSKNLWDYSAASIKNLFKKEVKK